ncbi:hypothetical protein AB1Y20_019544 [Prymnesium parvum]|uniref:RING-type domain-containing protein n=1 Tax=Prymnesium parvum TaxID=97485 RepID=A0AB34JUW7_PRYPA
MPSRLVVDGTMRRLATNESSPSAPPGALSNAESFFRYVISRTGFSASESALASLMHDYLAVHPSSADESGQAPLGLSETELAALTEVLKRLPCSHTFCKRCTCRWMEWHTTCPLCRTDCRFPNGVSATYSPRSRALRPVSAQPPSERRLGADDTIYSREPLASPTVDSTAPVPPSTPVHSTEQRRPQPPGPTHPPRTERMPSSCRNPASSGPPAAEGPTTLFLVLHTARSRIHINPHLGHLQHAQASTTIVRQGKPQGAVQEDDLLRHTHKGTRRHGNTRKGSLTADHRLRALTRAGLFAQQQRLRDTLKAEVQSQIASHLERQCARTHPASLGVSHRSSTAMPHTAHMSPLLSQTIRR